MIILIILQILSIFLSTLQITPSSFPVLNQPPLLELYECLAMKTTVIYVKRCEKSSILKVLIRNTQFFDRNPKFLIERLKHQFFRLKYQVLHLKYQVFQKYGIIVHTTQGELLLRVVFPRYLCLHHGCNLLKTIQSVIAKGCFSHVIA